MYLRFVSPLREGRRGMYYGIFQATIECRDNEETPFYLREAIRKEFGWFKKHLPEPAEHAFARPRCPHQWPIGICWFRSEAREMINRAYYLSTLIGECDMVITVLKTRHPGQVLYKDKYQIVAIPEESTPTAWG